jgi:hypothetical protein
VSLFTKSIDSIIADITAKIEQLHIVAEYHKVAAEAHAAIVAERTKLANLALKEEARAKAIAAKFAALVS